MSKGILQRIETIEREAEEPAEAVGEPLREAPACPACGRLARGVVETVPSRYGTLEGRTVMLVRCESCRSRGLTVQGRAADTMQAALDNWVSARRQLELALKVEQPAVRPVDVRRDNLLCGRPAVPVQVIEPEPEPEPPVKPAAKPRSRKGKK